MKKIILTFALCLSAAGPAIAQNNVEAMRSLMVTAMMQYGQRLYDRGDFDEASAVFNHVLIYNHRQAQALQYLKDMGRSPVLITPTQNIIMAGKSNEKIVNTTDVLETENLQKAIEAKKQAIEDLRSQIMQLRANIASQT